MESDSVRGEEKLQVRKGLEIRRLKLIFKSSIPKGKMIQIPAGTATLGADFHEIRYGWDNEFPKQRVDVPTFKIAGNFCSFSSKKMRTSCNCWRIFEICKVWRI